jgi:hypothetical protein
MMEPFDRVPIGGAPLPIAAWHPVPCPDGVRLFLRAHLHGRDAQVSAREGETRWRWEVLSPAGHVLASGTAGDRDAAEMAAEEEIFAVHPPSEHLIDELVG